MRGAPRLLCVVSGQHARIQRGGECNCTFLWWHLFAGARGRRGGHQALLRTVRGAACAGPRSAAPVAVKLCVHAAEGPHTRGIRSLTLLRCDRLQRCRSTHSRGLVRRSSSATLLLPMPCAQQLRPGWRGTRTRRASARARVRIPRAGDPAFTFLASASGFYARGVAKTRSKHSACLARCVQRN